MNYSDKENSVRVDFFKASGKWYTTEAVMWTGQFSGESLIYEEFAKSLRDHFASNPGRLSAMTAVCLHPYHQHEHPLMIVNGGWFR